MFSESDLRCLKDDEVLIITSNKPPILAKQNTYYINDDYKQNIKPPVKIKKKSINRIDVVDKILDMQVDSELQEEYDYDIKKDLFSR
jgi:type IV secretion system protein VirD4